jgi:hypothetical protein
VLERLRWRCAGADSLEGLAASLRVRRGADVIMPVLTQVPDRESGLSPLPAFCSSCICSASLGIRVETASMLLLECRPR